MENYKIRGYKMKINIRKNRNLLIKSLVCIYIISLSLGSAVQYISKSYYIYLLGILGIVQCICCFDLVYLKNIKKMLNNRLLQFYILWLCYGTILFAIYYKQDSIRFQLYKTLLISVFTGIIILVNVHSIYDIKLYMVSMLVAMLINFVISYFELMFGIHIGEIKGLSMIDKTFVGLSNPNNYASFLLYSICFLFIIFGHKINENKGIKKLILKIILFVLSLVLFYIEVRTGSATGILGVILFLLGGVFLNLFYKKFDKHLMNKISWIFLCIYVFILFIVLILLITNNTLSSIRLEYLNNGIIEFLYSLGFGLGPGGSLIANNGWIHNLVFEIIYDYGIIIGISFLFIIGTMIVDNKKNIVGFLKGFIEMFLLLLPIIWISSSSALSLHFTWAFITLLYQYINLSHKSKRIINE